MSRINVGDRWHFLKIIDKSGRIVTVKCVCGTVKNLSVAQFYGSRPTKSCGCKRIELLRAGQVTHGHSVKGDTPQYRTFVCWQSMIWRCYNKNRDDYARYGGRGIRVCVRWRHSFENFLSDMGLKPSGMTLGRLKNDRGYSPGNCEWQTAKQQARNTCRTLNLTLDGVTMPLCDWSEKTGIHRSTIGRRLESGWSVRKSLTEPLGRTSKYA